MFATEVSGSSSSSSSSSMSSRLAFSEFSFLADGDVRVGAFFVVSVAVVSVVRRGRRCRTRRGLRWGRSTSLVPSRNLTLDRRTPHPASEKEGKATPSTSTSDRYLLSNACSVRESTLMAAAWNRVVMLG